jgi:hypothetical protein
MRLKIKKAAVIAAAPVVAFAAIIAYAYATPSNLGSIPPRDPGNPTLPETCAIQCQMMTQDPPQPPGGEGGVFGGGPVFTNVSGSAVTQNVSYTPVGGDQLVSTTENLISLQASGDDPVYGHIVTTLDQTQPVTPTTIRANQLSDQFPATGNINFRVTITLGSQPGAIYRSMEEIQIDDPNLQSLRPHVNAHYRLRNPVRFENIQNPGVEAFTLQQLNVTIN